MRKSLAIQMYASESWDSPGHSHQLPKDVDWHLLGGNLGNEMLWLANRVVNLENALESLDLSKNDHDGFFERRIEAYAHLAARAMDLIARLATSSPDTTREARLLPASRGTFESPP